jgi:hypothetical protein
MKPIEGEFLQLAGFSWWFMMISRKGVKTRKDAMQKTDLLQNNATPLFTQ